MVKLIKKLSVVLLSSMFLLVGCDKKEEEQQAQTYQITLASNSLEVNVGEQVQFKASVTPNDRIIFYEVRDDDIASISTTGLITGLKVGETVCYASVGDQKAICNLFVKELPMESSLLINLESTSYLLNVNDSFTLPLVVKCGSEVISEYTLEADIETSGIIEINETTITAKAVGKTSVLLKVAYQNKTTEKLIEVEVI